VHRVLSRRCHDGQFFQKINTLSPIFGSPPFHALLFEPILTYSHLTSWPQFEQTASSNTIFSMKNINFSLWFHWNMFFKYFTTEIWYWFRKWLIALVASSHFLNQCQIIERCNVSTLEVNGLHVSSKILVTVDHCPETFQT
jgi:hypothetical protein